MSDIQNSEHEEATGAIGPVISFDCDMPALENTPPARLAHLKGLIAELPQYPFLDEPRINRWLNFILSVEPERVEWHIARLRGFGGSEMGVIVAPMVGEHNPFRSTLDVYQDKMMLKLPDGPSGDTRRGTFMEDTIRDIFRAKYNAQELTEELAKMAGFSDPKHPWLVGNPDDLVRIGNKVYMVDYKCPRPGFKEKYDKNGISFDYYVQLHHYTLIARKLGIHIDGLLLSSFDMVTWDVDVRGVEMSEPMFDNILAAGDWLYFECMLKNEAPRFSGSQRNTITEESENGALLRELLDRSLVYTVIANRAYAKDKDVKAEIAALLEGRRFGNVKQTHSLMEITPKIELDQDLAAHELTRLGYVLDDFMVPSQEIDYEKLLQLANTAGLDVESCRTLQLDEAMVRHVLESNGVFEASYTTETYKIGMSLSRAEAIKKPLNEIKSVAEENINEFMAKTKGVFVPENQKSPGRKPGPGM
ncbi:YqaJ viral recombinase family protein [Methylobacillus sp. Pita2]|uniref:YqaJ viral recombinase family protein n=1 Tax=Methylobacillus sp. Pita2 TaxID=3383245 RepID=UPI0038B5D538